MSKSEALAIYRKLLLARGAEERIRQEYFKDEIKTPVHLGIGQEGIAIGVLSCVRPGTKVFGTYRNHALYLAMTEDTDGFFAELYGKASGSSKGKAGSMHLAAPDKGLMATSAVVGTTIPLAVGVAFANAYRKSDQLTVCFFGEGAVEEGVLWESLNFSCLKKLRVLFVCEDNGLAIHTPTSQRQGFRSIPEALQGFRCHIESGDGSDVRSVIASARKILVQMTENPQPGFLHLTYFRFLEHVGPREDFDAGYRRRPTPEEMERLDPLQNFERCLSRDGCAPSDLAGIRALVQTQIDRSLQRAHETPFPDASELMKDIFAP